MSWGTFWGSGPWGDGTPGSGFIPPTICVFRSPLYPIPPGVLFGEAAIDRFSGTPTVGPLVLAPDKPGFVYFSPALLNAISGNEIDIDRLEIRTRADDIYLIPIQENNRVFTFGINSRTNDSLYRSQPSSYTVVSTMVQTIPPGPTTLFKVV